MVRWKQPPEAIREEWKNPGQRFEKISKEFQISHFAIQKTGSRRRKFPTNVSGSGFWS